MTTLRIIDYGSCDYHEMVALRDAVLRKPLGLSFTPEYLQQEVNDMLIGCFDDVMIVGCCILTPQENGIMQLRQMAVAEGTQGQGIGSQVLAYAEGVSRSEGFSTLMMHAREVAVPFYKRNGYAIQGDLFTEVGIPHYEMFKRL